MREAAPLEARSGATTVQLLAEHKQCVTLLIAGGVVAFLLGECHSHTIVHRVLMGVSLWYKKNLSWEKKKEKRGASGFFSVSLLTWQTPDTDGDKLLAAESLSREQRRTLKLLEGRGKSSVPRLLMSGIVGAEFPAELISD